MKQIPENKFMTPTKFAQEVEKIAHDNTMNYIDSIVHYCESNDIEIESVSKLISKPLKEKLKGEALKLNFMKKTTKAKLILI